MFRLPSLRLPRKVGKHDGGTHDGIIFWFATIFCVVLYQTPIADIIGYPLSMLAVFAHELGHCVAAELVSGGCVRLELLPNLGGTAYHRASGDAVERVFVAGAGILGPGVLGGIVLVMTRRFGLSCESLLSIAFALLITATYWSHDAFTRTVCFVGAGIFMLFGMIPIAFVRSLVAQAVAILLGIETVAGWDYAFIESFERDGQTMMSDTGTIAKTIGGPHPFWAGLVCFISALIFVVAFLISGRRERAL